MESNINTTDYWNHRFGSGDWQAKGGFSQTRAFAEAQVARLHLPPTFAGKICDFGCGAGDAFPVYRSCFPLAQLTGVDFSGAAIDLCNGRYGEIARFIEGGPDSTPASDIIVASNVVEHLENHQEIISALRQKCQKLFVIVPFKEFPLSPEHISAFDEGSFSSFPIIRKEVFLCDGWSEITWGQLLRFYARNLLRSLQRKRLHQRRKQILYEIKGAIDGQLEGAK